MKQSAADGLGRVSNPAPVRADATRVTPRREPATSNPTIGPRTSGTRRIVSEAARMIPAVDAVASAAEAGASLRRGDLGGAFAAGAAVGFALTGLGAVNKARKVARVVTQERIARSIARNRTAERASELIEASDKANAFVRRPAATRTRMGGIVAADRVSAATTNIARSPFIPTRSDMHRADNWMRADAVRQSLKKKP